MQRSTLTRPSWWATEQWKQRYVMKSWRKCRTSSISAVTSQLTATSKDIFTRTDLEDKLSTGCRMIANHYQDENLKSLMDAPRCIRNLQNQQEDQELAQRLWGSLCQILRIHWKLQVMSTEISRHAGIINILEEVKHKWRWLGHIL